MMFFIKILLSLSFSGTLLILLFFLFKLLWKDKLSKQWQYYIWLIVILRLLLPFAPKTNLVGILFQKTEQIIETANISEEIKIQNSINETDIEIPLHRIPLTKPNTQSVSVCIFFVWFITALILLIRKITIYQEFTRYVKAGEELIEDIAVLNHFGSLLSQAGIKKNIELSTNKLIFSPLFIGMIHPCIVLPDITQSDLNFFYTIRHELIHYKRRDMLYKWLVQITICIHWFNPFVYLMGREINRICELSCDEAVHSQYECKRKGCLWRYFAKCYGSRKQL